MSLHNFMMLQSAARTMTVVYMKENVLFLAKLSIYILYDVSICCTVVFTKKKFILYLSKVDSHEGFFLKADN